MFYSHTFLAKKSPLGTVWIAAHLERRIKKHQLDEIDISSYAECIMFPEVPIALRLSGHLLYGLVRIYSLKVKYLVQDCNRMVDDIRTVFTSVQVNLPVDADRAPFESVTLPNTFDLDAVELDDYQIEGPDNHRKTYDQITLQDQIQFEGEQYVSIFINEDSRNDSSPRLDISNRGAELMDEEVAPRFEGELGSLATPNENALGAGDLAPRYPMEDDILPPFDDELGNITTPTQNVEGSRDHAPNNHNDTSAPSQNEGQISDEPPEVMRDAVNNSELEWADTINDVPGDREQSVPPLNKNGNLSPIMEHLSASGEGSFPSSASDRMPAVASADDLDILNTRISFGHQLPEMELQPSPPVNQNMRRTRKRKQFFDQTIVLTNDEMKRQLNDTGKLVCKRRKLPCSVLDVWRFTKTRRNELIIHEPLFSGLSAKLQDVFERKFPPVSESASFEASSGHVDAPESSGHRDAPQTDHVLPDMDMEPEQPRFATHADETLHDFMQSSPGRDESTPAIAKILDPESERGKSYEPEVLPTFENPASAEPVGPELATPSVNLEEQLYLDDSNLGGVPSIQNSADVEELTFLEASNVSSGYDVTDVGTMSMTTRKVAQYLKELSPNTPEEQSGCLSLNGILEGKTRKQCARMFFETLALKSYGLIDVQQEDPYGDILISRTPALSSTKF